MSELKDVAGYINENGLPSNESMRADIESHEREITANLINQKLDEYRNLFERWKNGNELSDDEVKRMTDLSQELTDLTETI